MERQARRLGRRLVIAGRIGGDDPFHQARPQHLAAVVRVETKGHAGLLAHDDDVAAVRDEGDRVAIRARAAEVRRLAVDGTL